MCKSLFRSGGGICIFISVIWSIYRNIYVEKGFNALAGVRAVPANTWIDFKKIQRDLKKPEVQEAYETIIIDTADIAYEACEKYIVNQYGQLKDGSMPRTVGDIPYGAGYKSTAREFDTMIREIFNMGYGVILISHDQTGVFTKEDGTEYTQIIPTLDKRARLVCERMCDIIGYSRVIENKDTGTFEPRLFLRGTSNFVAGSRFKHMVPHIPFTYEALEKALIDAIEAEELENPEFVTEEALEKHPELDLKDRYDEARAAFDEAAGEVLAQMGDEIGAIRIKDIIDTNLGVNRKVAESTPRDTEALLFIVEELKNLK